MSAADDRREVLEDAFHEALGRAYRYGLVAMAMAGHEGATLGYPESAAEEGHLLAAVDAYAAAAGLGAGGAP